MNNLESIGKSIEEEIAKAAPPFEPKHAMEAIKNTDISLFRYFPKLKMNVMTEKICREFQCKPVYYDMPHSFESEMVYDEDISLFDKMYADIATGAPKASTDFRGKDGITWFRITMTTVEWDEEHKPEMCVGVMENYSSVKSRERELLLRTIQTNELLNQRMEETTLEVRNLFTMQRQMVESLSCGVLAYTLPERKILLVNEEAQKLFHYEEKSIAGFGGSMMKYILPEDHSTVREVTRSLQKAGDSATYQFRICEDDGRIRIIRAITKLLEFEDAGQFILSVMQDVTETVEKNIALNDLNIMQEQIVGALNTGVVCYTVPDHELVLINEEARRILECGPKEDPMQLLVDFYQNRVLPKERDAVKEKLRKSENMGTYTRLEYHIRSSSGEIWKINSYRKQLKLGNGKKIVLSTLIDLTEQDRMAALLKKERKQYRDAMTANCVYFYSFDVTEGYLDKSIVDKQGNSIDHLGLSFPISYEEMLQIWETVYQPEILTPEGNKIWTREGLISQLEAGNTNVEMDYYIPSKDCYIRQTTLLSKEEGSGHVLAIVIAQDVTQIHREKEKKRQALLKSREELQKANKELRRMNESQRQKLTIIGAMSNIYYSNYFIDLTDGTFFEISSVDCLEEYVERKGDAEKAFAAWIHQELREDFVEELTKFTDLSTLAERMRDITVLNQECVSKSAGWIRVSFIAAKHDFQGEVTQVLWVVQHIDKEKQKELDAKIALQDAYVAANQANAAKTEFFSSMSHDIRTPINAIIGMTAIAGTHLDDKERVADCLSKITISSKHLLGLINEVLDMNKIESGKLSLTAEEFNLSELVDNLLTMSKPQIEEKRHKFSVTIQGVEHEKVIGDSQRIQQVFMNLISNAVKYTPEGGKIQLLISEKPANSAKMGCYEFIFQDNGIGMSQEFLPSLFEPFARAKDIRVEKMQGTGLGMPITKNIVQMMNGDIKVESKLDEGSKFTVTIFLELQDPDENAKIQEFADLPILVVDNDEIACESTCNVLMELGFKGEWVLSGMEAVALVTKHHEEKQDFFAVIIDWKMPEMDGIATTKEIRRCVGKEVPIIIISAYDWSDIELEARAAGANAFISKPLFKSRMVHLFKSLLGSEPVQQSTDTLEDFVQKDFVGKRTLLVEDNELNAEISGEILSMTGLSVEYARDGKEALDILATCEEGYFDIVFMDIQMPIMNGYEATRAIRELPGDYTKKVPIIAMTANAFAEDVQAAKDAGMNEHIAKPIDFQQLMSTMRKWLNM